MKPQTVEKALVIIIKAGLYATLLMPFIVTKSTLFPFVFGKAIFFQIIVEIALIFWVALLLLFPQYRPWFYRIEKTRSGNVARRYYNWLNIAILAWFAGLLLATLFSVSPVRSFWGTQERMTGVFTILHFGLYYFMLISVMQTKEAWRRFLWVVVGVGLVVVGYGAYQFFLYDFERYSATAGFGNPGLLGSYLFFYAFFPLILAVLEYSRSKRRVIIIVLFVIELIMFASIVFNSTRAVWVGLFVALVSALCAAPFIIKKARKKFRYATGIVAVFVLGFGIMVTFNMLPQFLYAKVEIFSRVRSIGATSLKQNARVMAWEQGLRALQFRPLFGYGPENFNIAYNRYYNPEVIKYASYFRDTLDFDKAHNSPVEYLVTGGIIGALGYVLLLLAFLYTLFKKGDSDNKSIRMVLFFLLIGYTVHTVFTFDTVATYLLLMIIFAFAHFSAMKTSWGGWREVESKSNNRAYGTSIYALPAVVVIISASIALLNVKPLIASGYAASGRALAGRSDSNALDVFNYYHKSLSYNTIFSHEIIRFMAMDALGKMNGVHSANSKDMLLFMGEQLQKYSRGDWFIEVVLGRVYGMLCDEEKDYCRAAFEHLHNAGAMAPARDQVYATLTGIYLKMGQYKEAKSAFERSVELGFIPPSEASVYMQIGFMYAQLKEFDASLKYYEMALNVDKSNIQILESIALVSREKGDREKAKDTANQIKDIDPKETEKVDEFLKSLEQTTFQ